MSNLDKLTDEILEFLWKSYPTGATYFGIHKYDHDLNRMDRDSLIDINKKTKEYLTKLSKIAREELSDDEYIDWRFLQYSLESDIKNFEEMIKRGLVHKIETTCFNFYVLSTWIPDFLYDKKQETREMEECGSLV